MPGTDLGTTGAVDSYMVPNNYHVTPNSLGLVGL